MEHSAQGRARITSGGTPAKDIPLAMDAPSLYNVRPRLPDKRMHWHIALKPRDVRYLLHWTTTGDRAPKRVENEIS